MGCHYPITAWKSRDLDDVSPTGRVKMVFREDLGYPNTKIELPCGQCIGCRLDRARGWTARILHEASLHEENCFVTLTYKDDPGTLNTKDMQNMMKALRKRHPNKSIRFFQCGEYGDLLGRPHHHLILFNHIPEDKKFFKLVNTHKQYVSEELSTVWPHGLSTFGELTYDSAAYVAKYCLKKINGEASSDHYQGRKPEYITMSRKPGIGKAWFEKFKTDIYNHDKLIMAGGFTIRPPKYYDELYDNIEPMHMRSLKAQRRKNATSNPDNCEDRREVKSALAKLKEERMKQRNYEKGLS